MRVYYVWVYFQKGVCTVYSRPLGVPFRGCMDSLIYRCVPCHVFRSARYTVGFEGLCVALKPSKFKAAHSPSKPRKHVLQRRAYRQVSSALPFVPMPVESFGRLEPGPDAARGLGDQAVQAGGPGLSRAAFISGALRELSGALCRSNASLCRSGAYIATRAAGRTPMRGLH
jgi:hypothetical protein